MSGLSKTLCGRTLLGFGLGWVGTPAAQGAAGARIVSIGLGVVDLTAV